MDFLGSLMGAIGLSSQHIEQLSSAWPELYAKLKESLDQGKDPQEPEVRSVASRLLELIQKATGKNIQSQSDLQNLVAHYGPLLKRYLGDRVPDSDLIGYISRAVGL